MRSILRLVAITSILAGCGTNTVVESTTARALSFATPTPYVDATTKVSFMREVDFDGDGHLDIAVADASGSVGVMRNLGDGTFADIVWKRTSAAQQTTVLTAGDLNGDGLGDLLFVAAGPSGDPVIDVIYGAADGSVAEPTSWASAPYTSSPAGPLMLADLNGDGTPDLVQCSSDSVNVTMVSADGKAAGSTRSPVETGRFCAAGDFNADGRVDVVTQEGSGTIGVNLTDDAGAFPKISTLYKMPKDGQLSISGLYSGDVNGDGRADVLVVLSGSIAVQLADADGSLADPILSDGKLSQGLQLTGMSAKLADLNGDGHLDIVMANGGSGSQANAVAIMLGDGAGNFTQSTIDLGLLGDGPASDIAVGDFDGDGLPDIAVAFGERNYVLRNTSH